jgi:DNA-binding GntR family transcriptional regulator
MARPFAITTTSSGPPATRVPASGLLRLAQSGLVDLNPNKGATIATCGPREAREIFEARIVVESAIIKDLTASATENDLARLRSFLEDERQAYAAGRMRDARYLSRGFHLLLADVVGNRVLANFLRELINKQPLLSWTKTGARSCFCGNQAHSDIFAAIARRDAALAVELDAEHLRELERQLVADRGDVSTFALLTAGDPDGLATDAQPESPQGRATRNTHWGATRATALEGSE